MTLGTLLVAIGLAASPPVPDSLVSADSALALMKKGGYTMMWRHGQTDYSVADQPGENTERYQQRNLSDVGVALARSVGTIFRTRGIPVADVQASPMYRTMETAQYAFNKATKNPLLRALDPSAEEKALILEAPPAGMNRVLVTHHFIIERDAPGIKPGQVGEGEAAIVKSDGKTLKTIAVIKIADWARLVATVPAVKPSTESYPIPEFHFAGVSPEMAATVHSGRGHVILSYIQAFNSGRDAMKAFFENEAVVNPERSTAQRLESFDKLRTDLGGLATITGLEIPSAEEMSIKATTTTGKQITITFKQETTTPFKVTSISFQMPGGHGG
jgi:phosphohistidine phosphatase SixA